jgi:hypothetical protein
MIQGRKNQNYVLECFLHMSVLVIDCYWCAFGEIQDRFDLRIPPDRIAYTNGFGAMQYTSVCNPLEQCKMISILFFICITQIIQNCYIVFCSEEELKIW